MSRPSDRAIAAAFREAQAMYASAGGSYDTRMIERRARELDASGPQGAEAVGEVMVDRNDDRVAHLWKNGTKLPVGTFLYTHPPVESAPGFVGWWREDGMTPYVQGERIGVMLGAGWKPVGIISPEAMQEALAAAQENAP